VVTADVGFASMIYLSSQTHAGNILPRLPFDTPMSTLNEILVKARKTLVDAEICGSILVIDQNKIRIRRSK